MSMPASLPTAIEYGVAGRPLAGERESGDLHAVIPHSGGMLVAVADGLGHGYEAALASKLAVRTLAAQAHLPLLPLVKSCHEALIKTRGVALCIALLEWRAATMTWLSIGNVAGVLLRAGARRTSEHEHVLTRNGVVGARLPPLRTATLPLCPGDLLIMATDGLRDGFHTEATFDAPVQDLAERILARHGKVTDDALVLVGRWKGQAAKTNGELEAR
ncbi:PP2C family serine/threonine-protein phosphatase [Reyranella sp.]|uniref:PP2C family serine/threonine-protein phosphatase n=1 Tax=Reyranella sp. TaxID=1929291 RepID=UPI003D0F212D